MADPEFSTYQTDRESQLARLVGNIIETNFMHQLLEAYQASADIPELRNIPRSYLFVPLPANFGTTQPVEIKERKEEINRDLRRLGGFPCRYTDTTTRQTITSTFIAWHGPVRGNSEQHKWTASHQLWQPMTVPAEFLDSLRERYIGQL